MAVTCSLIPTSEENLDLILSLIYGFISIALYVVHIVIIIRKTTFHHPFFYQFILLTISNIVIWLDVQISQRFIIHPFFCSYFISFYKQPNILTVFLVHCYYTPLACQFFTVIVISVSRLTVVLWPIKFWARYSMHTLILIIFCSFLWTLYLFTWTAYIDMKQTGKLWLQYTPVIVNAPLYLMPAIHSVLCFLIIVLTTIATLLYLYKLKLSTKAVEANLFWTSIGFSLTTLVVAFYMIAMSITSYFPDQRWLWGILMTKGYIYDVNCLLPAWLLLLSNRQIRRVVLRRKTPIVPLTTVLPLTNSLAK